MTPVEFLRKNGVDCWRVNQGENVALTTKAPHLIDFARDNKQIILSILESEEKKEDSIEYFSEPVTHDPNWFVGITTSPRKRCCLTRTIKEVREAGWEPVVLAEPGATETNAETLWHDKRQGAFHNWKHMVYCAIDSKKPYSLLMQDDLTMHPDTKRVVEGLMPEYHDGLLSLYTSRKYGYKKEPGVMQVRTKSLWGAVAMVFPRHVLCDVLMSKTITSWLGAAPRKNREAWLHVRRKDSSKIANVDTAISKAMWELGRPMHFMVPSPVSHTSRFSTLKHGGNRGNRQAWPIADTEIPLEWQVQTVPYGIARKVRVEDRQFPKIDQVIVTSFSPKRQRQQRRALNAWKKLGLHRIIAVQLEEEVEQVEELFPEVQMKIVPRHGKYKLPLLRELISVSRELNEPIVLTNSDIEPYCTQDYFLEHWVNVPEKTLQWGQRYDYENDFNVVGKCPGIDIFRITPDMEIDPGEDLNIGMVAWDYWLPYILYQQDYVMKTDYPPVFFHEKHEERHWDLRTYYPQAAKVAASVGLKRTGLEGFAQAEKIYSERRASVAWHEKNTRVRSKPLPKPTEAPRFDVIPRWGLDALGTNPVDDLTIITTLFNPSVERIHAYERWKVFLGEMAVHAKCYEVVAPGEKACLQDSIVIPSCYENTPWQKEAVLNHALRDVNTRYVAWLDPDFLFDRPDWAELAIEQLQQKHAVQVANGIWYLGPNGEVLNKRLGAIKAFQTHGRILGNPGAAWVGRTEALWDVGGLFWQFPLGGNDSIFSSILTNDDTFYNWTGDLECIGIQFEAWRTNCRRWFNEETIGYIDTRAYHLWHMTDEQRQYDHRARILKYNDFDPYNDVCTDHVGLIRWNSDKPKLHKAVDKFFKIRNSVPDAPR